MFSAEIKELRRREGCRISSKAEQQDKRNFNPWDGENLIYQRVLERYDEDGYTDAPDSVKDAALAKFTKTPKR